MNKKTPRIITHEANTAWWGKPVGIISEAEWFLQDEATRSAQLAPYAWVEFKAPLRNSITAHALHRAGFFWADVQINFRLALQKVPDSPSLAAYHCASAAEKRFHIQEGQMRAFQYERFLQLPGVTERQLDARYVRWANQLISEHPEWCLHLTLNGKTQGWFLSEAQGTSIKLQLAMLAADATASGQHLYQRAAREYAKRGGILGLAAFSIRNTPVMNIYTSIGSKFTEPTAVWLWLP